VPTYYYRLSGILVLKFVYDHLVYYGLVLMFLFGVRKAPGDGTGADLKCILMCEHNQNSHTLFWT